MHDLLPERELGFAFICLQKRNLNCKLKISSRTTYRGRMPLCRLSRPSVILQLRFKNTLLPSKDMKNSFRHILSTFDISLGPTEIRQKIHKNRSSCFGGFWLHTLRVENFIYQRFFKYIITVKFVIFHSYKYYKRVWICITCQSFTQNPRNRFG